MAVLSSRDRRFRLLAEAVAAGEPIRAAGARLEINAATLRRWPCYASFRILVAILRAEAAGMRPSDPAEARMIDLVLGRWPPEPISPPPQ